MHMDEIRILFIEDSQRGGSDAGTSRGIEDPTVVTVEDFSRLVSGVYSAAVTPQHWGLALREIYRAFGGTGGGLLMADGATWSIDNSTIPAQAAKTYAEYYYQLDYRARGR